jgi:hypothetical protein
MMVCQSLWADFVEKLQNAKFVFFRRNSVICESQFGLCPRDDEGVQQRHMLDLADPLAKANDSACVVNKFPDLLQNRSFSTQSARIGP